MLTYKREGVLLNEKSGYIIINICDFGVIG